MKTIVNNYYGILKKIRLLEKKYHRPAYSVSCLAVSKRFHLDSLLPIIDVGQRAFGESYLQEALPKISALQDKKLEWHYIGRIQSKKCVDIAHNFSWVHTIYRIKEIEKLAQARLPNQAPLQVCIQIKLENSQTKEGASPEQINELAHCIQQFSTLQLRGLMTIPPFTSDFQQQCEYFKEIKNIGHKLNKNGIKIDTYSMGMTQDLEAAISQGATIVRVGTGIFGPRDIRGD